MKKKERLQDARNRIYRRELAKVAHKEDLERFDNLKQYKKNQIVNEIFRGKTGSLRDYRKKRDAFFRKTDEYLSREEVIELYEQFSIEKQTTGLQQRIEADIEKRTGGKSLWTFFKERGIKSYDISNDLYLDPETGDMMSISENFDDWILDE